MPHPPERRRGWTRIARALTAAVVLLSGCATPGQVETIVAESNAALVSPYVDIADAPQGDWQQAVQNIDRFIEAHADNAVLVNHLRVRQAMLLTANGQRNLADQYWGLVDREALDSDRDRVLTDLGPHLSWWYRVAPEPDRIGSADAAAARTALSNAIPSAPADSDLRIYLATLRAQLEVRMARDSHLASPSTELPASLEAYIGAIGADEGWITGLEGLSDQDLASARQIRAFRYRIWLRELIGAYKRAASDLMLPPDEVDWKPDWVDDVS